MTHMRFNLPGLSQVCFGRMRWRLLLCQHQFQAGHDPCTIPYLQILLGVKASQAGLRKDNHSLMRPGQTEFRLAFRLLFVKSNKGH